MIVCRNSPTYCRILTRSIVDVQPSFVIQIKKMEKEIIQSLENSKKNLLDAILLFDNEQFNMIPFEGSWTAGQVCDHLFKAESGITDVWQGNSRQIERAVNENVAQIEGTFLNFDVKFKSPEFIIPSNGWIEKDAKYEALKSNRNKIIKVAKEIDLSLEYTDLELPVTGALTGIEWISFINAHAIRHTRQLKNIYQKLTA